MDMEKFLGEHPAILDVLPTIVLRIRVKSEDVLMFSTSFSTWYSTKDQVQITQWIPNVDGWHVYISISGRDFEQKANDFCKNFEEFQSSKSKIKLQPL